MFVITLPTKNQKYIASNSIGIKKCKYYVINVIRVVPD